MKGFRTLAGMRLDWSEVDALVVSGVPARGFLLVRGRDS
jgi:hypothetical protein